MWIGPGDGQGVGYWVLGVWTERACESAFVPSQETKVVYSARRFLSPGILARRAVSEDRAQRGKRS